MTWIYKKKKKIPSYIICCIKYLHLFLTFLIRSIWKFQHIIFKCEVKERKFYNLLYSYFSCKKHPIYTCVVTKEDFMNQRISDIDK